MTLNASGTISLASSVEGESIALELDQAIPGQIALNDTNVRQLATKLTGAVSMPVDFWGKGTPKIVNGTPTIVSFGNSSVNTAIFTSGLATTSNGTSYMIFSSGTYLCAVCSSVENNAFNWVSISASGTVSAVKQFTTTGLNVDRDAILRDRVLDSSGNLYFLILVGGIYSYCVIKIDSTGTISYAKDISTPFYDLMYGIGKYSGAYYATARLFSDATKGIIFKINGSGIADWAYTYPVNAVVGGSYGYLSGCNPVVDNSDNIYTISEVPAISTTLTTTRTLYKLNSNGVFQQSITWSRTNPTRRATGSFSVYVDSSGNIYLANEYRSNSATVVNITVITKLDSSMTVQWQRQIASSGGYTTRGLTTDSSGNIYFVGYNELISKTQICKWNSSGTLQWQRSLTVSDIGMDFMPTITTTTDTFQISFESFVASYPIGCETGRTMRPFYFCFPSDGSKTGTYSIAHGIVKSGVAANVTFTYAATSQTETAGSLTYSAGGSHTLTATSFTTSDRTISTQTSVVSKTGQIFI